MMYLGYLLMAAVVYSYIEGWDYLDAVYFVNVTLFTIGFGDFSPQTHLGRSLFFPMAVGGILFVGLIISDVRSLVLESGSRKVTTRVIGKARYKALSRGDPSNGVIKLRGVAPKRIDVDTELERRAQEFQIMRDVLAGAAKDNRTITLIVSAGSFFLIWLIGAVVFWQTESAVGGENWSYFESLYFVYVALLTIGYGDFYPQTNSAKPAFVFWSLIALPTLTVLIGSIGYAVSDFASASINFLSEHTVKLTKVVKELKKSLRDKSIDTAKEQVEEARNEDDLEDLSRAEALDVVRRRNTSTDSEKEQKRKDRLAAKEAGYAYRPYMVIKAIKDIVGHMDEDPAKTYTFAEWTKYLELLHEDESSRIGHRVPGKPEHGELEAHTPPVKSKTQAWSWMGQESPLISNDNEPKWLLTRLIETLEKELKYRGDTRVLHNVATADVSVHGSGDAQSSST